MIHVVRITDALPSGFDQLQRDARADGWTHMDRLEASWADGSLNNGGQAVFAAWVGSDLAGICALTHEPSDALPGAYRMRHFYVAEAFRGQGVGRALASA